MSEKHWCEARIREGFHTHRCGRGANYQHEGKWYCKTHHPVMAKERDDAKDKAMREKWARNDRLRAIERAKERLRDAYAALGELMYPCASAYGTYDGDAASKIVATIDAAKSEIEKLNKGGE